MNLLIVESPNKCKKIQSYLGQGWQVEASFGHIRDMPVKSIGVDAPDYFPDYEVPEKSRGAFSKLKKIASNASEIWLATDPDREGEAIAWHLEQLFGKNKVVKRVTFNEITKSAILQAIKNPRQVDKSLFLAQQGRRVLDRLFGYKVSPILSAKLNKKGVSAGRVQSVALRLVVEREQAILNFQSISHFGLVLNFVTDNMEWSAKWDTSSLCEDDNPYVTDKSIVEAVANNVVENGVVCVSFSEHDKKIKPPAPLITSTLQQASANLLKISVKETGQLAQKLFEDGHITYMRTDNPNLSQEGVEAVWDYLRSVGAGDYVPDKPNKWKTKESAQEAHEAIRPTDFAMTKLDSDNDKLVKLYGLIWRTAVASQMKDSINTVREALLESHDDIQHPSQVFLAKFKATSSVMIYDGWKFLIKDDVTNEDKKEENVSILPALETSQTYKPKNSKIEDKKTKPPRRYSETSLVKALEREGIGRPSTYASIISIILDRQYVVLNKRFFEPTELGIAVVEALKDTFSFLQIKYTRDMESQLDLIANRKANYKEVVSRFDSELDTELVAFNSVEVKRICDEEAYPCPTCAENGQDGLLRRIKGKQGFFWGCSRYAEGCSYTAKDSRGKPAKNEKSTEFSCPSCGKGHLQKRKGKYGHYWGCDAYPDCKTIVDDAFGKPLLKKYLCPACNQGELKPRKSGKNKFWGCSNYKNGCKFSKDDKGGKPQDS